jgi:serine/threonine protein kinase
MAIMITLDHPGISRLYEVYDYKSSYVMILELCEGGELFKKIAAQSMNEETAAAVMVKLLQALMYIHAKGIVHRDLKP